MSSSFTRSGGRILVIDDNRAIHDDFKKILTAAADDPTFDDLTADLFGSSRAGPGFAGFEVDSAFQGRDGVERVKQAIEAARPYALAFVDMRMPPGWDGIATTSKLWEMDADLQVVICTAYSDYSWEEMCLALGQSDRLLILKKPFDNVEVLQLASTLTEKWRRQQDARNKIRALEAERALLEWHLRQVLDLEELSRRALGFCESMREPLENLRGQWAGIGKGPGGIEQWPGRFEKTTAARTPGPAPTKLIADRHTSGFHNLSSGAPATLDEALHQLQQVTQVLRSIAAVAVFKRDLPTDNV